MTYQFTFKEKTFGEETYSTVDIDVMNFDAKLRDLGSNLGLSIMSMEPRDTTIFKSLPLEVRIIT
jgi:hypothetical protein